MEGQDAAGLAHSATQTGLEHTKEISDLVDDLTSGDDWRAERAARWFAANQSDSLSILKLWLNSPIHDLRWWAVRIMADIVHPMIPELLVKALKDEASSVRQCAALALRHHPNVAALSALLFALGDQDRLVARLAGDALVAIGVDAVPGLLEVMHSSQLAARIEAVRCLALIGDERAIPTLCQVMDEDSALLEYWANKGLEKLGFDLVLFNPDVNG